MDAKLDNNGHQVSACRIAVGHPLKTINIRCSLDHGLFDKLDAACAVKAEHPKIVAGAASDGRQKSWWSSSLVILDHRPAAIGKEVAPLSAEELEWMAEWYDEHDDSSVI